MSSSDFDVNTFLSSVVGDGSSFIHDSDENSRENAKEPWFEPGYEGKIDYRIRNLSYSSLLTLHSCPRKFELYRKRSSGATEISQKSNITFAFGHIVGEAIQQILDGKTEEYVIWRMFLGWHAELFAADEKANKSFFAAITAVRKFINLRNEGFLNDYELVYVNGRPACELSFCINFPDGFRLRGSVDAVLRHRTTGEILVLEIKTTGSKVLNPAAYKNSSQALGYSLVLDHLFPEFSSYKVLYLVYQTVEGTYTPFEFIKTYLQRAQCIQELLLDIESIKMYENAGIYPMRGESCLSFFQECTYYQVCTMSNDFLIKPCKPEDVDPVEYQINVSLVDLLESQLSKVNT